MRSRRKTMFEIYVLMAGAIAMVIYAAVTYERYSMMIDEVNGDD